MSEENKSVDILGIRPVASSIEKVTEGVIDGARAFLSRVCLPAAEEFGLILHDNVKAWRAANAVRIAHRAEEKLAEQNRDSEAVSGNPRVVCTALEQGSWNDDAVVQDFWAGLLASACDELGGDDANCVFISLLSQLNGGQVRLLRYAVQQAPKFVSAAGWPYAKSITIDVDTLKELFKTADLHRIDVALDHLRVLELIGTSGPFTLGGGFTTETADHATIDLSSLALNMYLAGEGTQKNAIDYWSLERTPEPKENESSDGEGQRAEC